MHAVHFWKNVWTNFFSYPLSSNGFVFTSPVMIWFPFFDTFSRDSKETCVRLFAVERRSDLAFLFHSRIWNVNLARFLFGLEWKRKSFDARRASNGEKMGVCSFPLSQATLLSSFHLFYNIFFSARKRVHLGRNGDPWPISSSTYYKHVHIALRSSLITSSPPIHDPVTISCFGTMEMRAMVRLTHVSIESPPKWPWISLKNVFLRDRGQMKILIRSVYSLITLNLL